MGRLVRLSLGAAALSAVVTVAWPAAAGAAAADGGLALEVRAEQPVFRPGDQIRLTLAVTNTGTAACGLTRVPHDTVQVISVRRDGEELTPAFGRSFYDDGLGAAIAAGIVGAEPGSTVEATLASARATDGSGTDTTVLRSVTATPSGSGLDTLWPVEAPGRYEVTVRYAIAPVDAEVQPCVGAAAGTVSFAVGEVPDSGLPGWLWWLAGGALVLAVAVLVVIVLARRRRRAPASAAALLLLLGLVAVAVAPARPASAYILTDPSRGDGFDGDFSALVGACMASFEAPGGDPAGIIPYLQDGTSPLVTIVPVEGGSGTFATPESPDGWGSSVVTWNPTSTQPYGDGVARDPCSALYHELSHAYDIALDAPDPPCGSTGLPTAEVRATLAENRYRASQGLPPRTEYGGHALPADLSACDEPVPPEEPSRGPRRLCEDELDDCARTSGDPHLVTFDRLYYNFQAVGEFVLVRSTSGPPLEVQARQAPLGQRRAISVNSAVAFRIGEHRVSMTLVDGVTQVHVDGELTTMDRGERPLAGGGTIVRRDSDAGSADGYDIRWPDGSVAAVDQGIVGYRLLVRLDPGRAGLIEGLLGNFDGDPANDLVGPAGVLSQPAAFDDLYPSLADSWRISQEASLFTYASGESTQTFTDATYPDQGLTLDGVDASARARAESLCRWAGVEHPWLFAECVFDVAVTGRLEFAVGTAGTQGIAPPVGAPIAATPIAEAALAAGGDEVITFTARAGDAVFVDIVAPTWPGHCSPSRVLDPEGRVLSTGCIIGGAGVINRTELDADGQYTVLIEGFEGAVGRAMVRVYASQDIDGTIEPNGAPVSVTVQQPGSVARYRFDGTAGQRAYLAARLDGSTSQCTPLRLLDQADRSIGSGCFINGRGEIEATVLPADGTYTVLVDLVERAIGTVDMRLYLTDDEVGSIAVDGPAVEASIDTPGAVDRYGFTAPAGTTVVLSASDATLPGQCSPLRLENAEGDVLTSGCLISGAGGFGPYVLPETGDYTVVVDPSGAATGRVTLSLRSG